MTMLTRRYLPFLSVLAFAVAALTLGGCKPAPQAADTARSQSPGAPQAVQVTWTLAPEADAAQAKVFCAKCHEGQALDPKRMRAHPLRPAAPAGSSPAEIEAALRQALPPFASCRPVAAKPDAQPGAPVAYEIVP